MGTCTENVSPSANAAIYAVAGIFNVNADPDDTHNPFTRTYGQGCYYHAFRHGYRLNADIFRLDSLVGSGHIDKGAIISAAGDSAWASSPDLQLKPEEMKAISAIVGGDSAAKDKAFAEGLYIAGERYVMARAEDRSIYARSGRLGVAVAKTGQAIVIGHHGEAQVAGNATSTVEGLADYLIKSGY
ncbi:probable profilin [Fusarium oxysporum]|uniref:Profilin n=1 Tax=Fusarium oxysporum TaxID=5507 RepID=A0A2H3TPI3_FUSOX|nr:probable profilin [Fusarium oxysporum]